MLILSLDSAGSGCSACVWRDGEVLAAAEEQMQRGQDQRLMPLILEVMKQASVEFDALDRIAVTRGPGSFTGLRIGLAAARGIGLAAGKPVVGIDRFAIFREQTKTTDQNLLIVIESRRAELYCRFYPASDGGHEPIMMTREEIATFLDKNKNTIVVGDADGTHANEVGVCALLASRADTNDPAFLPRPLYIRPPDVTFAKQRA
jgi:tRNA threonylcarbamoyladenosine biosynthesis protein TsaB